MSNIHALCHVHQAQQSLSLFCCLCAYFPQGTTAMFGYSKIELEAANIAMLMPQPFSQRHPSYLSRYVSTMEPHILDRVQEVVALHKVCGHSACVVYIVGNRSGAHSLHACTEPDILDRVQEEVVLHRVQTGQCR